MGRIRLVPESLRESESRLMSILLAAPVGIGLYIAKTIIDKSMQGRISVQNTGEGAEFRIEV